MDGILLSTPGGDVLHLENSAAAVWNALSTTGEVEQIVDHVASLWPSIPDSEVTETVISVLQDLKEAGVLGED